MTLNWGANENTEKLPVTRLTCHALIYGARSVLKTKTTLALTTRCKNIEVNSMVKQMSQVINQ